LTRSAPGFQAVERRLRELGYVDGQTATIEFRSAEGDPARLPAIVAELAGSKVDVIVAGGPEATLRAVRQGAPNVPVVMVAVDYDPIALGYVAGLARPGGNITGVFLRQIELTGKRVELLKAAVPKLRRLAILWDDFGADQKKAAETAARALGLRVQSLEARPPAYDFAGAFAAAVRERADAMLITTTPVLFRERARVADLTLKHRLPAIFPFREFAEAGGLMTYGADLASLFGAAAPYVDKILKGARPGELPVEQPTKYELVINLKTARRLGLSLPASIVQRADHVIE
jgi:putative ABC transport system substrate-binding protein